MASIVYRSERVTLESLGGSGGVMLAACGGRAIAHSFLGTQNPAAPFTIIPPLACNAVCSSQAFSLYRGSGGRAYLFVGANGVVKVGDSSTEPDFTPEGASFIGSRQTVNGVTGWVLYPASGYAAGTVLVRSSDSGSCTDPACCIASTNPTVVTTEVVPAAGLNLNHLWRMQWEVRAAS